MSNSRNFFVQSSNLEAWPMNLAYLFAPPVEILLEIASNLTFTYEGFAAQTGISGLYAAVR
jgi:hypothetical protein